MTARNGGAGLPAGAPGVGGSLGDGGPSLRAPRGRAAASCAEGRAMRPRSRPERIVAVKIRSAA